MIEGEHERLLADTYNASRQREAWSRDRDQRYLDLFGRLRLDAVLFRTVVIPDTHLFDGRLLLELGPDRVTRQIARWTEDVPIEIRARSGDLRTSLADLLRRDG